MSKYKRSGRPQSSRSKRTTRPRLEVLESRLVLSTISGTVFNDLHVTGAIAANDPGLANRTVFVDLHNDGVLDSGDPSAVTDASGHYVITGVNSASHPAGGDLSRRQPDHPDRSGDQRELVHGEFRAPAREYHFADDTEPRSVRWRRERRRRGPVSQHPRAGRRPGRAGQLGRAAQGGRECDSGR